MSEKIDPPREVTNFCQQASDRYEIMLDEADGDPRVVAGRQALADGSWTPTIDARDARVVVPEK